MQGDVYTADVWSVVCRVTCTRPEYTSATPALPFSGFGNDLITDRDQQCRLATNDSDSYMCDPAIVS